jgi:hypothetical protein
MATSGHAFWHSFPMLEATLNIANDGSWCFGPKHFGSWWIFELNMRLGGDPNYHGHQQP